MASPSPTMAELATQLGPTAGAGAMWYRIEVSKSE